MQCEKFGDLRGSLIGIDALDLRSPLPSAAGRMVPEAVKAPPGTTARVDGTGIATEMHEQRQHHSWAGASGESTDRP